MFDRHTLSDIHAYLCVCCGCMSSVSSFFIPASYTHILGCLLMSFSSFADLLSRLSLIETIFINVQSYIQKGCYFLYLKNIDFIIKLWFLVYAWASYECSAILYLWDWASYHSMPWHVVVKGHIYHHFVGMVVGFTMVLQWRVPWFMLAFVFSFNWKYCLAIIAGI